MIFSLLFSNQSPTWPCASVGPSLLLHLVFLRSGLPAQKWQETPFQPRGKDSAFFRKGSCCTEACRLRRAHTSQVSSASYCPLLPFQQTATLWHRLSTEGMDLRMDILNEKTWFRCPLWYTHLSCCFSLADQASRSLFLGTLNSFCGGA